MGLSANGPCPAFNISAAPEFTKRETSKRRNRMSEKDGKDTSELSMEELEKVAGGKVNSELDNAIPSSAVAIGPTAPLPILSPKGHPL